MRTCPNVEEPITIKKNDQSKMYRSIQRMCGKDNPDMWEEVKVEKSVEDMVPTRFHKYLSVFKKKRIRVLTFAQTMGSHDQNQIGISAEEIKSICLITKRAGGSRRFY